MQETSVRPVFTVGESQEEGNNYSFGRYLNSKRKKAGLTVAELAQLVTRETARNVARSTIHAIECDDVKTVKKNMLQGLSKALQVNYNELASRWAAHSFGIKTSSIITDYDQSGLSLSIPGEYTSIYEKGEVDSKRRGLSKKANLPEEINIITLNVFKDIQSDVTPGSSVYVAATDFLDDDIFFKMVLANFRKNVKYYYYVQDPNWYTLFLNSVFEEGWDENLDGELDGNITHLLVVPEKYDDATGRHRNAPFPLNCVLIDDIVSTPQAYVGLIVSDRPAYYQVADIGLTYRIKSAFTALATANKNSNR